VTGSVLVVSLLASDSTKDTADSLLLLLLLFKMNMVLIIHNKQPQFFLADLWPLDFEIWPDI
jgi:hypothetical protein